GLQILLQLQNSCRFSTIPRGRITAVKPRVISLGVKVQSHRLDACNVEIRGEWRDDLRVACTQNDRRPSPCLGFGDHRLSRGLDLLDIYAADRRTFTLRRTDDF